MEFEQAVPRDLCSTKAIAGTDSSRIALHTVTHEKVKVVLTQLDAAAASKRKGTRHPDGRRHRRSLRHDTFWTETCLRVSEEKHTTLRRAALMLQETLKCAGREF